jgi:hypothetical protein
MRLRQQCLSESLLHWQATFITLSLGFVVYTAIFWNQILKAGDWRFSFEAIVVHALWAITALATAAPLAITWQAHKLAAIAELVNSTTSDSDTLSAKITAIRELRAIGSWNAAASTLTVLSAFTGPMIQALIK